MLPPNLLYSHIIISSELEDEVRELQKRLYAFRVVEFIVDEFKIEDAKAVISQAYISESQTKYLLLVAKSFNIISQNSLLKVLEEPPKNIVFIIITPSKSTLLPTICSRLPIVKKKVLQTSIEIEFSLAKIDYRDIFTFLKSNARIKKNEAKCLVESLYHRAVVIDRLVLTPLQLNSFERAYKLLELNARPQSVLAQLVMSFVKV
jgi:DNA polymerase-3 subunit delta'